MFVVGYIPFPPDERDYPLAKEERIHAKHNCGVLLFRGMAQNRASSIICNVVVPDRRVRPAGTRDIMSERRTGGGQKNE